MSDIEITNNGDPDAVENVLQKAPTKASTVKAPKAAYAVLAIGVLVAIGGLVAALVIYFSCK